MINQLLNKWIDNPVYFRYGFFTFLTFSIILNSVFLQSESNYYILYIFAVIFLGVGFYNKPAWLLVLFTIIVVACRYFLIADSHLTIGTFLIHLFTYLLVTGISAGLMKYVHRTKLDNIELTTTLAKALDSRDTYTLHHSENVARYSVEIAKRMKLSKDLCDVIRMGGLLHDIGKIGIPEHILSKPGKLTDEEYKIIKSHPTIGYEMIKHVVSYRENGVLDIVLYHHERYDGKGYPKGIKGKQIPLVARIVAVADVFDAMSSKRIYRDKLPLEYVLNEIRKNKGTQFDSEVVDAFLSLFEQEGKKEQQEFRRFG
ncbi:HD-GYP domain-containing protein [Niallia endozanthoxylica]|uniref:HD-GYP domain-containing protein n=1 Tax=Niallia endozanthoxylica TaxID=2036016 RepID=A0A5J5H5G3_9BACI|nr:HD domain-containing phosphohydrolase [Niallia endozanthoxylica]KAA9015497.1 HD-GYP domain-containing protein [Niallia endozanthoxylica]